MSRPILFRSCRTAVISGNGEKMLGFIEQYDAEAFFTPQSSSNSFTAAELRAIADQVDDLTNAAAFEGGRSE